MNILFNFSTNWNNKLYCDIYSTLRLSDRYEIGDKGIITLKNQPQHIAEIIAKNPVKLYAERTAFLDVIAYLDTGYNWPETVAILKKINNLNTTTGKIIYQYLIRNTHEAIPEARLL